MQHKRYKQIPHEEKKNQLKGPSFEKNKPEKNIFKLQLCALQWFEKLLEITHFPGE